MGDPWKQLFAVIVLLVHASEAYAGISVRTRSDFAALWTVETECTGLHRNPADEYVAFHKNIVHCDEVSWTPRFVDLSCPPVDDYGQMTDILPQSDLLCRTLGGSFFYQLVERPEQTITTSIPPLCPSSLRTNVSSVPTLPPLLASDLPFTPMGKLVTKNPTKTASVLSDEAPNNAHDLLLELASIDAPALPTITGPQLATDIMEQFRPGRSLTTKRTSTVPSQPTSTG